MNFMCTVISAEEIPANIQVGRLRVFAQSRHDIMRASRVTSTIVVAWLVCVLSCADARISIIMKGA